MSRFTPARRAAIAIWTGASMLWATTGLAVGLEKGAEETPPPESETPAVGVDSTSAIPRAPASGLVIIRSQPRIESPDADGSGPSVTPADPVPAQVTPPPRPVSSGS